jgi:molybdopterin-guanine dinucleotide biosynthesis protein A
MTRVAGSQTAIVLAGGRSSRMGRPKMALKIGSHSLLAHTTMALLSCCREVLIIAAPTDAADGVKEALAELRHLPAIRILHDTHAYQGPLPGIMTGLSEARGALAFVAAGDTPFLAPALISGLLKELENDPQTNALIPRVARCLQPLTAVYRTEPMAAHFRNALADGESSPRRSLRGALVREIPEENICRWDPSLNSFLNINDDRDFARARGLETQLRASWAED